MPRRGKYTGPVDDKLIGKRLREIRQSRGVTQAELSEELGISQSLVSEYEQGTVRLHAPLVAGFAKALNVSADKILGLEKASENGGLRDRKFVRRLRRIEQLPPAQQRAVLKLLDGVLQSNKPVR